MKVKVTERKSKIMYYAMVTHKVIMHLVFHLPDSYVVQTIQNSQNFFDNFILK